MSGSAVELSNLLAQRRWRLPRGLQARSAFAAGGAALTLAATIAIFTPNGFGHLLHSYLASLCFVISLSLGALFFVLLQYLTRSTWSVTARRLAEVMAAAMPWLLLLFLPVLALLLFGDAHLYSWNDPALRESDQLIRDKAAYLNAPFFVARTLVYFGIASLLARYYWRTSRRQDRVRDPQLTVRMQKWSGPAMIAFALTICFASFDWLMSLDPHWFSSIYGVYYFSGAMVGFFAALTLIALCLNRAGWLRGVVSVEHYHDLGKLLFGFNCFWAYIAFSQYLLIWYANIPEETGWFLVRQENGWQWLSLLLVFGHFVAPFLGLMSRSSKRQPLVLGLWSGWLLVMHWFDLYWLVIPQFSKTSVPLGWLDLFVALGVVGVYLAILIRLASRRSLAAIGDPRFQQSLSFHNH